jgi:hypothetical protein
LWLAVTDLFLTTSQQNRILLFWGAVVACVLGIFLGLVASATSAGNAFDVLTGSISQSQAKAGADGVVLAILGYLLVPAVIAALVASVAASRSNRKLTPLETELADINKELRAIRANQDLPGESTEII